VSWLSVITLKDGRVLVAGGSQSPPFGYASGVNASELYSPQTNSWTAGPTMPAPVIASAALLNSGNVLLAGGDNNGPVTAAEV
jgi:hypothetical protein